MLIFFATFFDDFAITYCGNHNVVPRIDLQGPLRPHLARVWQNDAGILFGYHVRWKLSYSSQAGTIARPTKLPY